jgi:type III secretion protein V
LRLAPEVEEALTDGLRRNGSDEWLALAPELAREITDTVYAAFQNAPRPCALLTQSPLRRHVRGLLEHRSPELSVVGPEELVPSLVLTRSTPIGP